MVRYLFVCFLIFTACSVVNCKVYRLPKDIKPVRYFLQMEPNITDHNWLYNVPNDYLFYGSVKIEVNVIKNTRSVTFNVKDLNIKEESITVRDVNANDIKVLRTDTNKDAEMYTIVLQNELVGGEYYNVTIGEFSGQLGYSAGFFYAQYFNGTEATGTLAATHFEPTGARKAFPCFDEPALKARFIISLIRRESFISLSNEELDTTEKLGGDRFKDTFKETPIMPTFTLAFTVSRFIPTEKLERHRIFAHPDAVKNGELDYALKTSVKTLQLLEEFTGINFTLYKMDSFAVPRGYFKEHAMENWGLVVYGEEHIKFDKANDGYNTQKRITTYIAHEFSHQWFGNLVTPAWWDYLWLSESFAAYFQYYIASFVQPTWRLMDQFLIDRVINSFHEEEFSHEATRSLNAPIEKSGQYPPFHIMYQKGSCIVRMMSHFLTHDVFQKGLQIYLENNKFKNTVPSDLYKALQEAVDKAHGNNLLENLKVAHILGTWDSLTGFPIVTVTRDYKNGGIMVEQSTTFNDTEERKIWEIPINYVFSTGGELDFTKTAADFWLTEESRVVNKNFPTEGWLLVNKQLTGYYRVNYDAENWERLIAFLKSDKFKQIHVLNRAQLLNDALYLAYDDVIPVDIALRLSEYLVQEKDYIPWAAFYEGLSSYLKIYTGSNLKREGEYAYFRNHPLNKTITPPEKHGYEQEYKTFQQYIRVLTKNLRDYLGNERKPNESVLDKINRGEIDRFFPMYFFKDNTRDYKMLRGLLEKEPSS